MLANLSQPLASFFTWLTRSSVQTGVLICLILAVQVVLRNRLAPRWRYALWGLVLIRLALPWAPESSLSVFNLYRLAERDVPRQAVPAESHGVGLPVPPALFGLSNEDKPVGLSAAGADGGETAAVVVAPTRIDVRPWLIPMIWLAGAMAVMACAVVESVSLASAIRRQRLVTDQKTLDLLEDCKAELGVHCYLAVVETPRVRSPALFGFLRPCLLSPPGAIESLGRERMRHVFLHELMHLRRHDIAANWVMTLLQALHWFNPLVWYGFHRMRADRELARDAAVLARFRPEELPQYGMTIVHLLETFSQRRRVPCLAGVLEDKNLIKRRIEMIASFKQSPRRWSILAVVLAVVLGALTLTNAQQPAATSDLSAKVAQLDINAQVAKLDIDHATLDDVIRLFGKPQRYIWGSEVIAENDLANRDHYIADFGEGFTICMKGGRIEELRFEGNRRYIHQGKLRVSDSLEDALKFMGSPKETVVGKELAFAEGVLYRDIDGRKGYCYYHRKDKNMRVFFSGDRVGAIYVTRGDDRGVTRGNDQKGLSPEQQVLNFDVKAMVAKLKAQKANKAPSSEQQALDFDINAMVAKLNIDNANLDDVIRLFGKPKRYVWGEKSFTREDVPKQTFYMADFGGGFRIFFVGEGMIIELRIDGNRQYVYKGKLRVGDSLDEAIKVMGAPKATVVGKRLEKSEDGVLYRDIEGRKGLDYYHRWDHDLRVFFLHDKVYAIYVTRSGLAAMAGQSQAGGFTTVTPIKNVAEYQDVRFRDLSSLDLSAKPKLPGTFRFNQNTVWPASLPAGVEPQNLLSAAMNPGLGIRKLHEEGLTGKGVNVAIIDQPLYQDHPEFAGKIVAYHDVGCQSESSMHGPAVASLLVGGKCGTAPDARLYYVAAPSWTGDTAFYAKALDWIVDQNAKLPPEGKIRVVSVSAAPSGLGSPFKKNTEMWDAAWRRAEKAGILVLDCTQHHGFIGPCYYDAADPENVSKCKAGFPGMSGVPGRWERPLVLVPSSPRTTAEEYAKGECAYQYCGRGGLSWSIPYCAGVLALGWQSRPDLDAAQMKALLFKSTHKTADGSPIINPVVFVRMVKAAK
jgi:serine protease AprX